MDKSEFGKLCEDALLAVIELAEGYSHRSLPRRCYLQIGVRGELVKADVAGKLVEELYVSADKIHPCVDIGVARLTDDGIPVIMAMVSGHAPCSGVERSWSGRPGPFNYYVAGQLKSNPLPEGAFAYTIVPAK